MTLEGTSLIPLLQEILEEPRSKVPVELVGALSGLLVRIMDIGADPLAVMVIRVLERSEDPTTVPALRIAAQQGSANVRVVAGMAEERLSALLGSRALESIDPQASEGLLSNLTPPQADERQSPAPAQRTLLESAVYDLRAD